MLSPNTFRVFSLDIHRTKKMFYTSVTIADGLTLDPKEQGVKIGKWVHRDRLNSKVHTHRKKKKQCYFFLYERFVLILYIVRIR